MTKRFEVKGVNDDKDFCECCGKSNLKKVVWIEDTETGEVKHFGVVCAGRPEKGFDLSDEIKTAVKRHSDREKVINSLAHQAYKRNGGQYVKHPTESFSWVCADLVAWNTLREQISMEGKFNY